MDLAGNGGSEIMRIDNPRRVLFIGPPDSGVLELLAALTGTSPEPRPAGHGAHGRASVPSEGPAEDLSGAAQPATSNDELTTTAGLSHEFHLKTRYYEARLPIWLDEFNPLTANSIKAWSSDFCGTEAREVVEAVGAWVLVFRFRDMLDSQQATLLDEAMHAINEVITAAHDGQDGLWDGVLLAVGTGGGMVRSDSENVEEESRLADWEDLCLAQGFEFVDTRTEGELKGVGRVRAALEANDWNAAHEENGCDGDFGVDELESMRKGLLSSSKDDESDSGGAEFEAERRQMEQEFTGLKMRMADQRNTENEDDLSWFESGGQDVEVERLEDMVRKLQAARDMSSHMKEEERKSFAARTVNELMKDL